MIDFIEERQLYIGLTPEQLKNLTYTLNTCKKNLKNLCEECTQIIKSFKKSILISVSEFQQYGSSEHVILVCQKFNEIFDDPDTFVSFQDAIDMRNYLMVTIYIVNCIRASNLMHMTIFDFQQAKIDAEIKGAYRFYNHKYKTSLVYGEKVTLVSKSLYDQIKTFITYVRPILTDDKFRNAKLRYIFTSSANDDKSRELMSQMNHSLVSKCLTRSFEKAKVFNKKRYPNVSPSRIRFSVITELIMLGEDTLDNIAHCFAKHSTQTCKKFYVQFFSNREAARLSWKSWQMFKPIAKEEEKAIRMRQSKLSKTSIPTPEKIKSWYEQLRNVLKLSEDLDLDDKGLDVLIAQFSKEMQLNEDLDSNDEEEVQEEEEDVDIDNEEVQVQAEEKDVDDEDEEVRVQAEEKEH